MVRRAPALEGVAAAGRRRMAASVRAMRMLLLLALSTVAVAADWTGAIEVAETLTGPTPTVHDREELDELARSTEERLRRARAEVLAVPSTVARILREDIGFLEAELQRVALARGGTLRVSRTVFFLAGSRLVAESEGFRLSVDRAAGSATVAGGGASRAAALAAPPPAPDERKAVDGPRLLDRPTRRYQLNLAGVQHQVDIDPNLPNPWAIGLVAGAPDDLFQHLASLPGLPMQVESRDGEVVRRLTVVAIRSGAAP